MMANKAFTGYTRDVCADYRTHSANLRKIRKKLHIGSMIRLFKGKDLRTLLFKLLKVSVKAVQKPCFAGTASLWVIHFLLQTMKLQRECI